MKLIGSHNRWTLCLLRRKNYEKRWLLFFVQLKSVIPSLWFALEDFLGGWREGKLNERMSQAILKWSWLHCLEWKYCRRVRPPPKFFLHFSDVARKLFSQLCPMSNIQWNSSLDFIRLFLVIWIGWCGQKKHHLPSHDLVQWIGMSNDLILVVECIYILRDRD